MRTLSCLLLSLLLLCAPNAWCSTEETALLNVLAEVEAFQQRQEDCRERFQGLHGDQPGHDSAFSTGRTPTSPRIQKPEEENDGYKAIAEALLKAQLRSESFRPAADQRVTATSCPPAQRNVYIVGAGIGGMAAAVYLIRDGHIPGKNIHIMEELPINGGSLDGIGTPEGGYVIRGGRMMNFPTFECLWALLKTIPSLEDPKVSVFDDIVAFNKTYKGNSKARLVNFDREITNFSALGLGAKDRAALLLLTTKSEKALGDKTIEEYFPKTFFKTNFWRLWATMFAFQPWHSAVEMKRYMDRFIHEFPRLHDLSGIHRTRYNQYDTIVLPIQKWLQARGVRYTNKVRVVDLDFAPSARKTTVERIHLVRSGKREQIAVGKNDLVFITNGSMTDRSSLGSMTKAPELLGDGISFKLWENIAAKRPHLGTPARFAGNIEQSKWLSFTVTCKDPTFFRLMEEFSGNTAGTGGLVTFQDSNWLMSIVLPMQPHFRNQPDSVEVFWGYALFPDKIGDYVRKPMSECTGAEILTELCGHLRFHKEMPRILKTSICIPCMMPYITAQFMPRNPGDRPAVVPKGSTNLGFMSQFCEVPGDCVFTVEYSVRAAQMAVYQLMGIKKPIPQIHHYNRNPKILYEAAKTLFR